MGSSWSEISDKHCIVFILDIESNEDSMFNDEISDESDLTYEPPKERLTGKRDLYFFVKSFWKIIEDLSETCYAE